jgi:putative endonuclease
MNGGFVYLMTNKTQTTLYTGVTSSLVRRVTQHRNGEIQGFTTRYNINCLVYFESFNDIRDAIGREKQIKGWTRAKKEALVGAKNPEWNDLSESVLGLGPAPTKRWRDGGGWQGEILRPCGAQNDG